MQKINRLLANNFFVFSLIIILGFLLYFKSLFFDFVYLDDNELILNNLPFLTDVHNIWKAFTTDVFYVSHGGAAYYRPLLTVSFMADVIFGGSSPFMFHLTSLIVHLVASILVFVFLLKLGYQRMSSIFLAIIFLVHPTLTQAVSWVPGRNDSLLAVFILASFIYFLDYLKKRKLWSIVGSNLFFALAIFTKETALILPFMFVFYLWAVKFLRIKIILRFCIGWVLALILWLFLHSIAMKNPIPMTFKDMLLSLLNNSPAAIQLLGKVFFPFNLSVLPNILDTTFVWGIISLILLAVLAVYPVWRGHFGKRKYHLMLFGVVWFILFLIPSFVRPDPNVISDFIEHRLYLPIIGIFIFLLESTVTDGLEKNRFWLAIAVTILFVFGYINFYHQDNFSQRIAFWKNASENSPHSPLAQRNLGAMYQLDNQFEKAKELYQKAIAINSYEPMVHSNLGLIYANEGKYVDAEKEYQTEISFNPNYANVHFNLGLLYYKFNKIEDAKKEWEKTLEINPEYMDAIKALNILKNSSN